MGLSVGLMNLLGCANYILIVAVAYQDKCGDGGGGAYAVV